MAVDETRRKTRLIEANNSKIQSLRNQVERLTTLYEEQTRAQITLEATIKSSGGTTMVPLGSGLQIPVNIESNFLPIIDIGSGVQIETTSDNAVEMLKKRNSELAGLIQGIVSEIEKAEHETAQLLKDIDKEPIVKKESASSSDARSKNPVKSQTSPKSRRRKRGTELTLDD